MKVSQAVDEFLKWKVTHMDNPHTYRAALRPLVLDFGNRETEDIRIDHITNIAASLGSNFMFLTVTKIFSRYCHWAKIPFVNPHLVVVKRRRDPVDQPFLGKREINDMCSIIDDDTFLGIRNQLLIRMLGDTGMRLQEILDLKVSNMDAQKQEVMVLTKKAHTNRYVAWSYTTHRLLQTYLGMRVSKDWKTDNLFINKDGRKLTKRGVEYMFAKISEEALGERHHPHETRHGKAHSVIEQGGEAFAVKTVLGHKNLESALTYLRLHAKESLVFARKYV